MTRWRVFDFLAERFKAIDGVFGSTTVFGQMLDWNPVEMIKGRQGPLQLLYTGRLQT